MQAIIKLNRRNISITIGINNARAKVAAPVARILALIDLLKNDKDCADQSEILDYIYNSTKELDGIIKDIVDNSQKIDL